MLGEMFYWLLNMSILGTVAGFIVLLLSRIKRIPHLIIKLLWIIPFIRLWVPFGFGSIYSIMNVIYKITAGKAVVYSSAGDLPELTMMNSITTAESYYPIVYKSQMLENVFSAASVVWCIIFTSALIVSVFLYHVTKSEIKDAEHYRDDIYFSHKITSPAVYGVIRPKIILPHNIAEKDMDYVLLHERVHISRKDNLWRVIAVITACLHWFNPFVWYFLKRFLSDMELSCDTGVLRICGDAKKKEYSSALLNCGQNKTMFASAFGGSKTRVRIENILSYKKLTVFSGFCLAVLVIAVAVMLLTNAPV
jgi:beta-lactamase regulating signal transducer with metallopeptidase domain